jgi:hypothetical protein
VLELLALHLPQPHVPAKLRPNRIKTWHGNYVLRSNYFLSTAWKPFLFMQKPMVAYLHGWFKMHKNKK